MEGIDSCKERTKCGGAKDKEEAQRQLAVTLIMIIIVLIIMILMRIMVIGFVMVEITVHEKEY